MLYWLRKPAIQIYTGTTSLLFLFLASSLETAYAEHRQQFSVETTEQTPLLDVDARSSLVRQRNQESDEQLTSLIGRMKEAIDKGNRPLVRDNLAQTKQTQEQQLLEQTQSDLLHNLTKYSDIRLSDLVNLQVDKANQPPDQDALEDRAVTKMQNLAAADADQAAIMYSILQQGDGLQIAHDHGVKMKLLGRELDKMQHDYENQGVVEKCLDIIGSLLPGRNTLSALNAYKAKPSVFSDYSPGSETDTIKGRLGELLNPGDTLQAQIGQLMLLSLPEFNQKLPEVIQNIRNNSSLSSITGPNLAVALNSLRAYATGLSDDEKWDYNFWAGFQMLSAMGVLALAIYAGAQYFAFPFRWSAIPSLPIDAALGRQLPLLAGATMSKGILIGTTSLVALSVLFPPTTEIRITLESFAGWHPLWKMGWVPDSLSRYEIAYPMLLVEWVLIALFSFTLNALSPGEKSDKATT